MTEKFEDGEKQRNLSEDDIKKIHDLTKKVWEVATWDLGAYCGTSEELNLVHKAQNAMPEVMEMFDMPLDRFGNWNKKEQKSITAKTLSPDEMKKLRTNLMDIEEVINWDIGAGDEEEIKIIKGAREALKELKEML